MSMISPLCVHCGLPRNRHGFTAARCEGSRGLGWLSTTFRPAGVALVHVPRPLLHYSRFEPDTVYLSRHGLARVLAVMFCNGFYVAQEARSYSLRAERGMRDLEFSPAYWSPPYARLRDALLEWVPYNDACREALAATLAASSWWD